MALIVFLRLLPCSCCTSAIDYTASMKIGSLCTIGDSAGVVIRQENLHTLGWFKGDQLVQQVEGDALVVRNLTKRLVRPMRTRKDFGNATVRRALRPRSI